MMTKRNNVAMRESNDNIDHKMVTTWIGFSDEVKSFSYIFDTRADFGPYFWPKEG